MAQTFRKILCPVDFDDNSMVAREIACKVAVQNDASLCLIHVVEILLINNDDLRIRQQRATTLRSRKASKGGL
jgi:nucleotide-binding universal stress UspA family protein